MVPVFPDKLTRNIRFKLNKSEESAKIHTAEGIEISNPISPALLSSSESENYGAGAPPYVRGAYGRMQTKRPWTIRKYEGLYTDEASNAFYRGNLDGG